MCERGAAVSAKVIFVLRSYTCHLDASDTGTDPRPNLHFELAFDMPTLHAIASADFPAEQRMGSTSLEESSFLWSKDDALNLEVVKPTVAPSRSRAIAVVFFDLDVCTMSMSFTVEERVGGEEG